MSPLPFALKICVSNFLLLPHLFYLGTTRPTSLPEHPRRLLMLLVLRLQQQPPYTVNSRLNCNKIHGKSPHCASYRLLCKCFGTKVATLTLMSKKDMSVIHICNLYQECNTKSSTYLFESIQTILFTNHFVNGSYHITKS